MITTISLQWASDLIEQKYIFSEFKAQKVTPARFTFTSQAQWQANVLPGDEVFVGVISTKLEDILGNAPGDYYDQFFDMNNKVVFQCFIESFEPNIDPAKALIRQNLLIECSDYVINVNTASFKPINMAMGYVFHLKV